MIKTCCRGLGDGSVGKVLGLQASQPEFEPQNPSQKLGMVAYADNPSPRKLETGRSLQPMWASLSRILSKLQASERACLQRVDNAKRTE